MKAHPHEVRLEVIRRFEAGERQIDISRALGLSYATVKNWVKRYKREGLSGLQLRYYRCGGTARVSPWIRDQSLLLKKEHSTWGGPYIRMKLAKSYPDQYIPSPRRFQRYFQAAGLVELHSKQPVGPAKDWAKSCFYRVQVDANEQLKTKDGCWCSYLTFTDEYSGAVLDGFVFPL